MKKTLILALVASLLLTGLSWAGLLLVQKGPSGRTYWACEDGLFRMGTDDVYTILDANRQVTYTVMVKERRYTVTTAAETRRRMEELAKIQKALKEKFKGFGKFLGKDKEGPAPKVSLRVTGESRKISGYRAQKVLELREGRPVAELWLSKELAREISRACDYAKLEEMTEAMFPQGQGARFKAEAIIKEGQVFGFPVKTVDLKEGAVTELIKVKKKEFPRSYFAVPAGFERVDLYPQGPLPEKPF